MMTIAEQSPVAPGRLGEAIDATQLLAYLGDLDRWVDRQRAELDRLGAAALASKNPDGYSSDIVLAETLWQAARTRRERLEKVWDSGRADERAREQMSQLIWGRLEGAGGDELVSLVEAIRLCDALVAQLGTRLELDPDSAGIAARIVAVRSGIERCRDLAAHEPTKLTIVDRLRARLDDLAAKAGRGADVTGPLGQLEVDGAHTERDFIVDAAKRRDLSRDIQRAGSLVAALEAREPALRELAARCRREIADPPRLAVPDVARLGAVPQERAELDAFLHRLDAVTRAFSAVEESYTSRLRERAELRYRFEGLAAKAQSTGRASSPTATAGYAEAQDALTAVPCDLARARFFVEQYQYITRELPATGTAPGKAGPTEGRTS